MKITFYDGHGKLSYNPHTEKNVGVGGAETVIIQTAKALAERGHEVSVYINCNFPNYYDKVKYLKWQDYTPDHEDVLVGFENFPTRVNAKLLVNWANRFYLDDIIRYPEVDKLFVVSEWHRDYFASKLPPDLVKKMVVVQPGVAPEFFESKVQKQQYNVTYAGHPGKGGMAALVPVMERMKLKIPEASLHVYGGGGIWGWDNEQYRPVYSKLINNGVLYHGQLGKADMVTRLNQAQIFLYPVAEHHKETFCLVVLEAMAAGCVVVASNSGNLRNLIGDRGIVIDGDVTNYQWSMEAVEKMYELFTTPSKMEELSKKSRDFAKQLTWQKTAEAFEKAVL